MQEGEGGRGWEGGEGVGDNFPQLTGWRSLGIMVQPSAHYCLLSMDHRRRIYTEEKVKVVCSVWG